MNKLGFGDYFEIVAMLVLHPFTWFVALLTIIASYFIPVWGMILFLVICLGYTYMVCKKDRPDEYMELILGCIDAGQIIIILWEVLK